MTEISLGTTEAINPFDQLIADSHDDPAEIQTRYESHRTDRNAQFKAKLLSPDFPGWQADEILHKLHTQTTNAFVDTRNNLTFYARPPQHIRELVAEIQRDIGDVAPTIWFTPAHYLHMTTMELASGRTRQDIEDLASHLQQSGVLPDLVDYTFHHRTRLVKPIISYDAAAMALSFVPAAGDEETPTSQTDGIKDESYTYHHLRRDLFGRVTATGVLMKPRYIVPSAHITIARFITQDGFLVEDSGVDGGCVVDHGRVAALVERIERINEKLRDKYWPQDGGRSPKGDWLVGQEKGLEFCKGSSWFGGGEAVLLGKGFH